MTSVKMFYDWGGINAIESKIDDWLYRHPQIKIINVVQSQSGETDFHIVVSIFYEY